MGLLCADLSGRWEAYGHQTGSASVDSETIPHEPMVFPPPGSCGDRLPASLYDLASTQEQGQSQESYSRYQEHPNTSPAGQRQLAITNIGNLYYPGFIP